MIATESCHRLLSGHVVTELAVAGRKNAEYRPIVIHSGHVMNGSRARIVAPVQVIEYQDQRLVL